MARGAWQQPAAQMALFAQAHAKKGKTMKPAMFNPYEETGTGRIKITPQTFDQFAKRMGGKPAKGKT